MGPPPPRLPAPRSLGLLSRHCSGLPTRRGQQGSLRSQGLGDACFFLATFLLISLSAREPLKPAENFW